jgi:hypothetical protein
MFSVLFYRDERSAERFERAGISKPAGWTTSPLRTAKREEAERTVAAINAQKPEFPAQLVEIKK